MASPATCPKGANARPDKITEAINAPIVILLSGELL